jgi:hypothetical protein
MMVMTIADVRRLVEGLSDGTGAQFFVGNVGTREVSLEWGEGSVAINVAIPDGYLLVAEWEWKALQDKVADLEHSAHQ